MRLEIGPVATVSWTGLRRVFGRFRGHLRPHRRHLALGALAVLGLALVELARPWPLKLVFDYVLMPKRRIGSGGVPRSLEAAEPVTILAVAALGVILVSLLAAALSYAQSVLLAAVGQKVTGAIRLDLFSHVQRLPQSYHDYRQSGELLMRLTGDISLLKDLLVSMLATVTGRLVTLVGMLGAMVLLNGRLTLVALGVMPLLLLTSLRFSARLRETSRKQRKKEGQMSAAVHEGLSGVTVTKIFGRERRYETLLGQSISSHVRAGLKATRLEAAYSRTVDVITALGTTLVMILGVKEVWRGLLSPGDLLIFFSYLRTAYKPLRDVADVSARLAKATACGERILEILQMPVAGVDKPGAISARGLRGEVRFREVSFCYRSGSPVLRRLELNIPAGQFTAIVGPSGAGKSTIGKLLLRLYEPEAGEILVDGVPITDYRVRSLRDQISVLAQESFLFRMSVRENIAFGRPSACFGDVVAAARKVGAHAFIERLPEGYETLVGEGGQTLSGGQRQRIAFARAALRDARILIFDEPASGLDPEAERAAHEALAAIKEGRTVLLITHRLGLLDLADQVAFVEEGTLVEAGALAELLAQGGRFSAFYQSWARAHATHGAWLGARRASPAMAAVSDREGTPASPVLPTDDVLGGLGLLLDAAAVGERVREGGDDVEGGSVFYLKYKPRTSCVAAYEFRRPGSGERVVYHGKCFAPSQFPLACHKAYRHRWTEPSSGPPVLPWPEATALLFAFPNDGRLDGLRILAKPRKLGRLVSAHLPTVRSAGLVTDLIRYKPERRAVFRSWRRDDGDGAGPALGEFYWRVYGNGEGPEIFRRMAVLTNALAGDGVRTPRPYVYDPERQILATEALPGRPLDEWMETEPAVSAVERTAEALTRLHAVAGDGLTRRLAEEFLVPAAETREMLSWLSEDAGAQAGRIVERLRKTAPEPALAMAFVHGDLHPAQVLVGNDGVSLLDFDRSHLGSPCADLGGFLAHLHLARLEGRVQDEGVLARAFVEAYAGRSRRFPTEELSWWTALALLLLALTPFRRLEADWPGKVRRILAASEERLC